MHYSVKRLTVLVCILSLFAFSTPAMAALFNGWGSTANITDPTGDAVGGGSGTDITAIWYALSGGNNYFRMDLAGDVTASNHANLYQINISDGQTAYTVAFDFASQLYTGAAFIPSGGTPQSVSYSIDGNMLQWAIPTTLLSGPFSFFGQTITGTTTNDSATVPIPNVAWLMGAGVVALVGLKRRRPKP
ncbi:MAG: hypothetical protein HY896_02210 [Deltaproteobacteria bacterium]|nr:hypothetical protein [Deltaproteobacteria bacterium]